VCGGYTLNLPLPTGGGDYIEESGSTGKRKLVVFWRKKRKKKSHAGACTVRRKVNANNTRAAA